MKVVFITTGLATGGAEKMLWKLLSHLDRKRFQPEVISLTGLGDIGQEIVRTGIPVHPLHIRRGLPDFRAVGQIAQLLRAAKPDLVQTWMYHADLLGGLAARRAGIANVVWGIRNANLDRSVHKRTTLWIIRLCAAFSRTLPRKIVCCSQAALQTHTAIGYDKGRAVVIPNGFDLDAFRPDANARAQIRQELGLADTAPLIGLAGRYDPQKDHANFVAAAALLAKTRPDVRFLLCGAAITAENRELTGWIDAAGIRNACFLLGPRSDMPRIMASLDIATTSSCGESFPNVVGEAMACGIPCVVTDAGDSAYLVGETGIVVPPRKPLALADGWKRLLDLPRAEREAMGRAARCRVQEQFTIQRVTAAYENLYEELIGPCAD